MNKSVLLDTSFVISLFEVIDHATGKGRVLVMAPGSFRELQFIYQDDGKMVFIEMKTEKGRVSDEQKWWCSSFAKRLQVIKNTFSGRFL
jgi:hypothetical protein